MCSKHAIENISYLQKQFIMSTKFSVKSRGFSVKSRATVRYIDDLSIFLQESRLLFLEKFKRKFRNRGDFTLEDFERRRVLGRGSFGTVVAVTNVYTRRSYAMKILEKRTIIAQKQVENTFGEKRVLQSVWFPFLVSLRYFFVDQYCLYFLIPLALCGELFDNLRHAKRFDEELCRFYASQTVMGLEYLHFMDLAYRDLKPENIVVFDNGYLKLTDFGFCKVVTGRTYTLCGTPEYMAPEVLQHRGYGKSVDWWSLGILIYEMAVGFSPFQAKDIKHTYEKILSGKIRFPKTMSHPMRHLIRHLLEPDLTRRLGNLRSGAGDIKGHQWFLGVDWMALLNQRIPAPFIPTVKTLDDGGIGEPYDPAKFHISNHQERFTDVFKDF